MVIPCHSSIYKSTWKGGELKMYGYIYVTKNNKNGKVYVGQHKSNKYDPSYLGSGKILKHALNKYGHSNFSQTIIEACNSKEELNEREKYWIDIYKGKYKSLLYNLAKGGNGGDTLYYKSEDERKEFCDKMTRINRLRCSSSEFKRKISKCNSERYKTPEERAKQSEKIKAAWSNPELKKQQSERLKNWYKLNKHDTTYLKIKCAFELNGRKRLFDSINSLKQFLMEEYDYAPSNNTFKKLLEQGKSRIPFAPYHKNKLKELSGMMIYNIDDDVETNCDECNSVETEISTVPKDEALISD